MRRIIRQFEYKKQRSLFTMFIYSHKQVTKYVNFYTVLIYPAYYRFRSYTN